MKELKTFHDVKRQLVEKPMLSNCLLNTVVLEWIAGTLLVLTSLFVR